MNEQELTDAGMELIEAEKVTPLAAAQHLVSEHWNAISLVDKKKLCTCGIAELLGTALCRKRIAEAPEPKDWKQQREEEEAYCKEVDRIHSLVGCTYKSHYSNFSKRKDCVGDLVGLPPEEQERKIAEEKARFDGIWKRECEIGQKSSDRMRKIIEDACDEIYASAIADLQSIILLGADGSMKSLLDFNADDARKWKREARSRARSWEARKAWFSEAALLLKDGKTVRELEPEEIRKLAEGARKVWKE